MTDLQPQLPRQWDAAVLSHPEAPICRAEKLYRPPGGRPYRVQCGYPIDPANGPLRVHPWCEAAAGPAHVAERERELYHVRADNRQRMMREATQQEDR